MVDLMSRHDDSSFNDGVRLHCPVFTETGNEGINVRNNLDDITAQLNLMVEGVEGMIVEATFNTTEGYNWYFVLDPSADKDKVVEMVQDAFELVFSNFVEYEDD